MDLWILKVGAAYTKRSYNIFMLTHCHDPWCKTVIKRIQAQTHKLAGRCSKSWLTEWLENQRGVCRNAGRFRWQGERSEDIWWLGESISVSHLHLPSLPSFPQSVCHSLSPSLSLSRMIYMLLLVAVVCWFALDTAQKGTRQLMSFFGLLVFIALMLLFSKHPFRVRDSHPTFNMNTHSLSNECLITYMYCASVAVVLANVAMWNWATVRLRFVDSQDRIWLRCTEMAWKTSWGGYAHIHTFILSFFSLLCQHESLSPLINVRLYQLIKHSQICLLHRYQTLKCRWWKDLHKKDQKHVSFCSIQSFMSFADVGSKFVFGASYTDHFFVFKVQHTPKQWIHVNTVSFS